MKENEEINGIIPDEQFGIRWKNGAIDRRMRGDGPLKKEEPNYTPTSVQSDEVFEHIRKHLVKHNTICDLLVQNSVIMESVRDGDVAYYNAVVKKVMDIECRDIKEEEFRYFIYRLKMNLMKYGKTILNFMTTAEGYSKFTGTSKNTVYKWMERGKLELFQIYDVKFIVIQEEEIMEWNRFLMEEAMKREVCDNRNQLVDLYGKMYGNQDIEPIDSVMKWSLYYGYYAFRDENTSYHGRINTANAYKLYSDYCISEKLDVLSPRSFSLKMTEMGFVRFNGRKRGFIYWKGKEV